MSRQMSATMRSGRHKEDALLEERSLEEGSTTYVYTRLFGVAFDIIDFRKQLLHHALYGFQSGVS